MRSFLLGAIGLILSSFTLTQTMTPDMQKRTGVSTLSAEQKRVLETWLNDNFDWKFAPKEKKKSLYLSQNLDNGKRIRLNDGSLYEISPDDWDHTSLWITPFPIRIEASDDPFYPCKLVNENTGSNVNAKQIEGPSQ